MYWFKHYHNATTSVKLSKLRDDLGMEGYGRYWALLELLCEKYDGSSINIELHYRELCAKLDVNSPRTLRKLLETLCETNLLAVHNDGKVYFFEAAILSELKGRDFKKARHQRGTSAGKPRIKKEEEEGEEDKEIESNQAAALATPHPSNSTQTDDEPPAQFSSSGENKNRLVNPDQAMQYWNEIMVPKGFNFAKWWPGGKVKMFMDFSKAVGSHEEWKDLLSRCSDSCFLKTCIGFGFGWFFDEDKQTGLINQKYFGGSGSDFKIGELLDE